MHPCENFTRLSAYLITKPKGHKGHGWETRGPCHDGPMGAAALGPYGPGPMWAHGPLGSLANNGRIVANNDK